MKKKFGFRDFGSGSGSKFNCAARVGSGRVRRSRVRAGFGLQFWARADLYAEARIPDRSTRVKLMLSDMEINHAILTFKVKCYVFYSTLCLQQLNFSYCLFGALNIISVTLNHSSSRLYTYVLRGHIDPKLSQSNCTRKYTFLIW